MPILSAVTEAAYRQIEWVDSDDDSDDFDDSDDEAVEEYLSYDTEMEMFLEFETMRDYGIDIM